ncbi:MAG: 1,4-alpha-glucan branching protein GlgB [Polyangiaceae bacterium]|nr:1,4-alpha-glucan branching protein GlgB [Polyangiaceae bacterium]
MTSLEVLGSPIPEFASIAPAELEALISYSSHDPHRILGAHEMEFLGARGVVVRANHPDATLASVILADGRVCPMNPAGHGLFGVFLADEQLPLHYKLKFEFSNGATFETSDPYRFPPSLGQMDLHLFNEGTHRRLWEVLGSHTRVLDGVEGTSFAVWAPNARRVSLVGTFNNWDGRLTPMRSLGSSGVWEVFVPGLASGELYKFELKTREGVLRLKTDPYARAVELPPKTASVITSSAYRWEDGAWMASRARRDPRREPMSIYEVHLGSWQRVPEDGNRSLSYRELAPRLVDHVRDLGFTHVELMPVAEHAYYPSWGYQVTGYYAPTSRYGTPDDFRFFVDYCHQHGVGVILDWVPAHFPKDDFALRQFDGTALYEHEDPRRGEHPDWGTLIFNYGRNEVKNFLMANALYWLQEFHVDGLRVDAVASMLYLDYSREDGNWVPNNYGGRENIEAIEFLRSVNSVIESEVPGAFAVAEESTAWGGVTRSASEGGLGFTLKWNMGWMHDTLLFFSKEPVHRKFHIDQLTFAMLYEYTESFINALSHDEVVHGKGSLVEKMPGDFWQKLANLRLLLTYQWTRPGKQLIFMGTELAQHQEWHHDGTLSWELKDHPQRVALREFIRELGRMYQAHPALWRSDPDPAGFEWIDCNDRENTVVSYVRRDGDSHLIIIINFTPVPREDYRVGVPAFARYTEVLSSDDLRFGGSEFETTPGVDAERVPIHGREQSVKLRLPPLGALILKPVG